MSSDFEFLDEYRDAPAVRWGQGASDDQIDSAVARVGDLPPDYKVFLRQYGWLEMFGDYVFGLGSELPPWANVVQATEDERTMHDPLPPGHVAIFNDGAGNISCLSTSEVASEGTSRVYVWIHDIPEMALEAEGFRHWLKRELEGRARSRD